MSAWREISNVLIDKGCFPYFCKLNLKIHTYIDANGETDELFHLYASDIHDRNVDIKVDPDILVGGVGKFLNFKCIFFSFADNA